MYGYTFLNTDLLGENYKQIYNEHGGNPMLDGSYNAFEPKRGHTVFAQVFEGLEVADAINAVEVSDSDRPLDDVVILSVTIETYEP